MIIKNKVTVYVIAAVMLMILFPASSVFSAAWMPEGIWQDFEGKDISCCDVISADGTSVEIVNDGKLDSNALKLSALSAGTSGLDAAATVALDKPFSLDEHETYIFSFDVLVNSYDGMRFAMTFNGDTTYQTENCMARIKSASGISNRLLLCDPKSAEIMEIELNKRYNLKYIIDGDSKTVNELYVNGVHQEIASYRFPVFDFTIESVGFIQRTWAKGDATWYDNISITSVSESDTNVFFSADGNDGKITSFHRNSDVVARAVLMSNESHSENGKMALALFDGERLTQIKLQDITVYPGRNYYSDNIYIDDDRKLLRVYLWTQELQPYYEACQLVSDSRLLEYKNTTVNSILNETDLDNKDYGVNAVLSKNMLENGSFENITYDGTNTHYAYIHCQYLEELAVALAKPDYRWNSEEEKNRAKEMLEKGLKYWVNPENYISFDNWYYRDIIVPANIGRILLIGRENLTADTFNTAANYMKNRVELIDTVAKRENGSNILQLEKNKAYYALYIENTDMLMECFERINRELKIVDDMGDDEGWRDRDAWKGYISETKYADAREGIQSDYSCLFHGPQIYSGTYGLTFVSGVAKFLADTNSTGLFPTEGVSTLVNHILEHYAYIGRGRTIDYSTIGRMISAKGESVSWGNFDAIYTAAEKLLTLDNLPRRDELQAFLNARPMQDSMVTAPAVTGHRYYWKADYTAHQKDNFLLTIKSASGRTVGAEAINFYNIKGKYLGDGATFIYRTGREYDDIFAAWDWLKIPGTTTENTQLPSTHDGSNTYDGSSSPRVGGVSQGNNGATAMELIKPSGLSAKKAWFMFDNEYMSLGTDISTQNENGCFTTVNQCLSKGDAVICTQDSGREIVADGFVNKKIEWALHDGVGYIFDGESNVCVENNTHFGDRFDISWDGSSSKLGRTDVVSRNIFTLWFEHSAGAHSGYCYTVVPGVSETQLRDYVNDMPLCVISNTGALQAVKNIKTGEKQAVFWSGGTANFGDICVTADKEVLVALCESNGKLSLSAASLSAKEETVTLTVNRRLSGEGAQFADGVTSIAFNLPGGRYAGSSVVSELIQY